MRTFTLPPVILAIVSSPLLTRSAPSIPEIPSEPYIEVGTDPKGITWPWRVFKSSPYTPPNLTITGNGDELAPGYIFMTPEGTDEGVPKPTAKESGGFVITSDNELVYALAVPGMTDLRVQEYNGESYITCQYPVNFPVSTTVSCQTIMDDVLTR